MDTSNHETPNVTGYKQAREIVSVGSTKWHKRHAYHVARQRQRAALHQALIEGEEYVEPAVRAITEWDLS